MSGATVVVPVPAQDKTLLLSPVNPAFTVPAQDKVFPVPPRT